MRNTSTWISRAAALAALIALSGCEMFDGLGGRPAERIVVASREVVVAGPEGYCIDTSLSRVGDPTPFVLMGSCASISGRASDPMPAEPAVLTVAVSRDLGTEIPVEALRAYVETDAGRNALSRTGTEGGTEILELRQADGGLLMHLADGADVRLPEVANTFWRALFSIEGRVFTASVMPLYDRPLSNEAGFSTLRELARRLRVENARYAPLDAEPRGPLALLGF